MNRAVTTAPLPSSQPQSDTDQLCNLHNIVTLMFLSNWGHAMNNVHGIRTYFLGRGKPSMVATSKIVAKEKFGSSSRGFGLHHSMADRSIQCCAVLSMNLLEVNHRLSAQKTRILESILKIIPVPSSVSHLMVHICLKQRQDHGSHPL